MNNKNSDPCEPFVNFVLKIYLTTKKTKIYTKITI